MSNERLARRAIGAILLTFVLLALAYSVVNPLHEATDELRHYRFVRHVAELRALPVQGALACSAQGHHPPLYYVLAALATGWVETGRAICHEPPRNPFWAYRYWEVGNDNKNQYLHGADEAFPWRGAALAAHLARAVNVAVGAAVVWLTYLIGRAIWPQRPFLAIGATAFVAFNPMFLYMAGAINNDVIAAFSGAAVTLACVRLLRDENGLSRRWGLILGLLYGMALLSKFNLAAIALGIELSVTWVAWRRRQWRLWLEVNLLIALLTALLAGWWFVRNQLLYGEPTGFERVTELWGRREPSESLGVALWELPYAWTSLWGRFGYGQVPLPQPIYDGLWQLTVVGLSGLLLPLARRRMAEWRAVRVPLALLIVNVLTFFAVLFNYLLVSPAGPMGRFFFPALPALALLIFYGLAAWFLAVRDGLRKVRRVPAGRPTAGRLAAFSLATHLGMLLLALVALCGYLRPAFAHPPTFDPHTAVPNPLDAQFDSLVRLRGYALSADQLRPGEPLDVTLYWEVTGKPPGDFLFFLHLVDAETGAMVAQRDTHPGLGNFPSSAWEPGDRFVETVRLYLPETAYTAAVADLTIGFYAPVEGYRLAITAADGRGLGDALPLGRLALASLPGPDGLANPLDQNFNNDVRLVGYAYSARAPAAGAGLTVTLTWEALRDGPPAYRIGLRVQDGTGAEVAALTAEPAPPTAAWQAGRRYTTAHALPLDALPPGEYAIHVALIDAVSGIAQNIVAEDGRWIDNRLRLANIRIR